METNWTVDTAMRHISVSDSNDRVEMKPESADMCGFLKNAANDFYVADCSSVAVSIPVTHTVMTRIEKFCNQWQIDPQMSRRQKEILEKEKQKEAAPPPPVVTPPTPTPDTTGTTATNTNSIDQNMTSVGVYEADPDPRQDAFDEQVRRYMIPFHEYGGWYHNFRGTMNDHELFELWVASNKVDVPELEHFCAAYIMDTMKVKDSDGKPIMDDQGKPRIIEPDDIRKRWPCKMLEVPSPQKDEDGNYPWNLETVAETADT